MKLFRPILITLLLAVAAWALWNFFFPPPERVIKRNLAKLAAAVSQNPEGNISRVGNANKVASFFDDHVTINLQGFGREVESIRSRNELQQMVFAARQNFGSIKVNFYNIDVLPAEDSARVILSVVAEIPNREPIAQDLKITFTKVDRAWLIRAIDPVQPAAIN